MKVEVKRGFMNSFINANLTLEDNEYAIIKTLVKTRLTQLEKTIDYFKDNKVLYPYMQEELQTLKEMMDSISSSRNIGK